jgi:glycogen debranching enzyme
MSNKVTSPDRTQIPEPVFDENPEWIDFYWRAWELAWDHVTIREGAPASTYMDEAFDPNIIWIWDTCFMVHFCKYAPALFPGIQSFDNFYQPLHDGAPSTLKIQHPDNPPLFAWIESEYLKYTGDTARIERILGKKGYLQKHFDFFENAIFRKEVPGAICPLFTEKETYGYRWNGIASGMDNTPRGREAYEDILWFDLLAQQALAALRISALADSIGRPEIAETFRAKHQTLKTLANTYYWNDEDGTYYDIRRDDPTVQVNVKTPAAYWGLLAGFCDDAQAAKLATLAADPEIGFGGKMPWPSVTPDDPDFHADGYYWQGGIWLPMAYMATCALREGGHADIADPLAENLLAHMFKTWKTYEPHTIWEAYSPTHPEPSTDKAEFEGQRVRPDFCGWSALGPISLLIESVIGIHRIDALKKEVHWRLHRDTRHGIRRLRFGDTETDLIHENGSCTVTASAAYTLYINEQPFAIHPGEQTLKL